MCGIAGHLHGGSNPLEGSSILGSMKHRGPDAYGAWSDDTAQFFHTRLSIIDVDPRANQPMLDATGRYLLVFNGELYNYRILRSQLSYPWLSESDTEVLLAWLIKYGDSRLEELDGMFAFGFYDTLHKTCLLARDRFGKKPLYYHQAATTFSFASELRTLLRMHPKLAVTDAQALSNWLYWQTIPGKETLLSKIKQVEPGTFVWVTHQGPVVHKPFTTWQEPTYSALNNEEPAIKELKALMTEAVRKRLVADVPFACFLSGGLDSSIVTALAAKEWGSNLDTFHISFDEDEFSEHRIALRVAKQYQTNHHEIRLRPLDFLNEIEEGLATTDHPSGDGLNTYVVSKHTQRAGFKMALTGLGGDEWFLGYPYFTNLDKWQKLRFLRYIQPMAFALPQPMRKGLEIARHAHLGASSYPYQRILFDAYTISNDLELPVPTSGPLLPVHPDTMSARSVQEWRYYTQPVLLRDTDQYSMAVGLELRAPFMDSKLVEFALSLPNHLKRGQRPKELLIKAFGDLLPSEVYNRKKQGFTLPWEQWMRKELNQFCQKRVVRLAERMQRPRLIAHWSKFSSQRTDWSWSRWWSLVALEDWMERNAIKIKEN